MHALVLVLLLLSIICGGVAFLAPTYAPRYTGLAVALLSASFLVVNLH